MGKISNKHRVIALVAAIAIIAGLLAGVAIGNYSNPTNSRPGIIVNNKLVRDPGTIITLGSRDISFNEFRYFYLIMRDSMLPTDVEDAAAYWKDDADGTKAMAIKASTEESLKGFYSWLDIADQQGIGLTEEERAQADAQVASIKEQNGTNFTTWMEQQHIADEAFLTDIMYKMTLVDKIRAEYETILSNEHADEILSSALSVQHILILFDEATENEEAEPEEAALEQSTAIYDQIHASEDPAATFAELRAQYDDDAGGQPEEGYTFLEGTMVDEFYEASMALKPGEISEPVRTDYGYHIILREPLNEEYIEQNKTSLISSQIQQYMNDKQTEAMEALVITPGTYYDNITPSTIQ